MNKNSVLLNAVLLALVGFPSGIQAATTRIQVEFEGNQVFTTDQLRVAMEVPEIWHLIARLDTTDELEQGMQRLRGFLIAEGYLTPRIGKPEAAESSAGPIFRVHLEEGPLYRLGEVKVTGATVFSETRIVQAFDIKQGDAFRGDAVRIWFERLKEMYANAGYFDWTPVPRQEVREPDSALPEGTVNLTVDMDEGLRVSKSDLRTPSELRPSPLEAFAARPNAKVVWSQSVGQLESQDARAMITALIVEDPTSTPSLMRGLRMDLAHNVSNPNCNLRYEAWKIMCERTNAAVFIEEERLVEVRNRLDGGSAQLRHMEFISRYEQRMNSGGAMVPVAKGLILCGYQFSDREPRELAAMFTKGIEELKTAPQ
jgi:Surface antigen variable number repeat